MQIFGKLSMLLSFDASFWSFWAACLAPFFGMFRKVHLLPTSHKTFDPKQLTKGDFRFFEWGALLTIR